jgi:hypothetical protein
MKKERSAIKHGWKGGLIRMALMTACTARLTPGATPASGEERLYMLAEIEGPDVRISDCQDIYDLAARSLGPGHYRIDILIDGTPVGHVEFSLN